MVDAEDLLLKLLIDSLSPALLGDRCLGDVRLLVVVKLLPSSLSCWSWAEALKYQPSSSSSSSTSFSSSSSAFTSASSSALDSSPSSFSALTHSGLDEDRSLGEDRLGACSMPASKVTPC